MIGLLGKKIGMTQIFDTEGNAIPVTVLEAGPCSVLQVKTKDSDGYQAVQLGFDEKRESRTLKPAIGHFKKFQATPKRFVREIRTENLEGLEPGKKVDVNNFAVGDLVDVIGTSIGRGFQGVVKRHGFKGGPASHGSMFGRVAGSIGSNTDPGRVLKGLKMPGQMGNEQVTIQNLRVEKIDFENHLILIRGAVPGFENNYVIVREAVKKRRPRKWRLPEEGVEELKVPEKKASGKKAKKAPEPKKKPAAPAAGKPKK